MFTTVAQTGDISANYFTKAELNNSVLDKISGLKLKQPNSLLSSPNWGPTAGSPFLGAATLLEQGFDQVTYIGAFASDIPTRTTGQKAGQISTRKTQIIK